MGGSELKKVSDHEKITIKYILTEYDLIPLTVEKVRSVYKITTKDSTICLKKIRHGTIKIINGYYLTEQLHKVNFNKTAKYYKTKNNELFVTFGKYIYYITEWLEGKECDIKKTDEAVNCAKLLAEFHLASMNIDKSQLYINNNIRNWHKIFLKCLNDLEAYKNSINVKISRSIFDIKYEGYIPYFYERGFLAVKLLTKSSYNIVCSEASNIKTICHNSFYYQNIIKNDSGYYIIDLNSIVINLQIYDLGKMISRLMYTNEYSWDFNKAKLLIDAYNTVNKLSLDELEIMLSLIIFPQKFWKLGRKKYIKHKCWRESKYLHKLKKIVKYTQKQDKFINDYVMYLDQYN